MQRAGIRPAAAGAAKVFDILGQGLRTQQHKGPINASLGMVLDNLEKRNQGTMVELRLSPPDCVPAEASTSSTPNTLGYGSSRFGGLGSVTGPGRGGHMRASVIEDGLRAQNAHWVVDTGLGGIRYNSTGQTDSSDDKNSAEEGASPSASNLPGIASGAVVGDSLTTDSEQKFSPPLLKISVEAKKTFDRIWKQVENELGGRDKLMIPKEIVWLNGAPGAGKGANTPFILKTRGFGTKAIQISDLLDENPETVAIMRSGGLVHDSTVLELLLRGIMKMNSQESEHGSTEDHAPSPISGVLVDGFPRTKLQVDFVKLLYDKLMHLHNKYMNTPLELQFPRPIFRIAVLYVEEEESVRRQLSRGKAAIIHNQRVQDSGIGDIRQVRPTDLSAKSARRRYHIFREHYDTLLRLKSFFPFHLIDAMGTLNECRDQIGEELQYQSALELDETTFRAISHIPLASDIAQSARQNMVARLDSYEKHDHETFKAAVEIIDDEIMPAIRARALSGMALYNTENPLFFQFPGMAEMVADILSERGYYVTWQTKLRDVPVKIDPLTNEIQCLQRRTLCFRIKFDRPTIRLADHAEDPHVYDHIPAQFYDGGNVTFSSYPSHLLPCFYEWAPSPSPLPSPLSPPHHPTPATSASIPSRSATSPPTHPLRIVPPPPSRFASGTLALSLLTETGRNGADIGPFGGRGERLGASTPPPAMKSAKAIPPGSPFFALPLFPSPRPFGLRITDGGARSFSHLEGLHGLGPAPHAWLFPRSFRLFSDF